MRSKEEKVVAILCADMHLSLNPPIWRSVEPNWFAAMRRPLNEIKELQKKFECPVICAGDIFDRWNSPPELINFACHYLPHMYAIPGQHDLPLHKYEDIQKSAYWTLMEAGVIQNLLPFTHKDFSEMIGNMIFYGFPFGSQIQPLIVGKKTNKIHIAVVHEYCCIEGKSFSQAPDESYLRMNERNLIGYDVIIFGDNHKGFLTKVNKNSTIFNCGTLMRRKSDEIDYKPQVGLLLNTGEVKPYFLDISKDKCLEIQKTLDIKNSFDIKGFIQELEKLGNSDLDFREAMKQYLKKNKTQETICNIIMKAMEEQK